MANQFIKNIIDEIKNLQYHLHSGDLERHPGAANFRHIVLKNKFISFLLYFFQITFLLKY